MWSKIGRFALCVQGCIEAVLLLSTEIGGQLELATPATCRFRAEEVNVEDKSSLKDYSVYLLQIYSK